MNKVTCCCEIQSTVASYAFLMGLSALHGENVHAYNYTHLSKYFLVYLTGIGNQYSL